MRCFVQSPNLPGRCAAVLYGARYTASLTDSLDSLGIESLPMPDNPFLDARLAAHIDLSVFHADGESIFLAPFLRESAFAEQLLSDGAQIQIPDCSQGECYPHDAQFNLCTLGEHIIYNEKTSAREIVDFLTNRGHFKLVSCRQGYSRCAVCVVDSQSIITADRGIALRAREVGLDVLLIQPGFIRLDGYAYGFIGGASFKIASDKLAFTGRLTGHPDQNRILCFLASHGVEPVYLTQYPAFDIGSAVPLLEN